MLSRAAGARLHKLERRYGLRECDIEEKRFASMSESELQAEIERLKRELIEIHGFTPEQFAELEGRPY